MTMTLRQNDTGMTQKQKGQCFGDPDLKSENCCPEAIFASHCMCHMHGKNVSLSNRLFIDFKQVPQIKQVILNSCIRSVLGDL